MTITVTPTVDTSSIPQRVALTVSASAGETSTTVTRVNADGTVVPVRTADGNPLTLSGGTGVLWDYEAPYGTAVSFSSVESSTTISAQVTVNPGRPWLIHPGVPALSMPIMFAPGSMTKRTRPVTRGVFTVMGRVNPVVVTDGARHGAQSTLVLMLQSNAERYAVEALTADASPLLLNVPTSLGFNVSTRYIAVGDMDYGPVLDKVIEPYFTVTLPFVEVDRPVGGSQAARTWADVIATYSSWQQVEAAYSSWTALISGP